MSGKWLGLPAPCLPFLAALALWMPATAAAEVPPPETVIAPLRGGPPGLPGHAAPPPVKPLPALTSAPATAPATRAVHQPPAVAQRAPRRGAAAAPAPRPPPRPRRIAPERVPEWVVMVDGGAVGVPDALFTSLGYEGFSSIRGVGLDVTVLRPTSARHALGGRLGVTIPTVAAGNWWGPGMATTYIDVDVVLVDLAFEYGYWRPLFGPLALVGRAGLGLAFVAGGVHRVATLPTCAAGKEATCPHWRVAGELSDPLATPVLPAVRATIGLAVELGAGLHLRVEGGLRDGPWLGAGVGLRR